MPCGWSDFDVNAVEGFVMVDGECAPGGFRLNLSVPSRGVWTTVTVDGPFLPPFVMGQGRYDTGDIPAFETGDLLLIAPVDDGYRGSAEGVLRGGTTPLNLTVSRIRDDVEDQDPEKLALLEEENDALRKRNEELEARLARGEGNWSDISMFPAAMDMQNASFASVEWLTAAYRAALERASWVLDHSATSLGEASNSVVREVGNTSVSIFSVTGEAIDSMLDLVPAIVDARLFTLVLLVMMVGCLVVFTVSKRGRGAPRGGQVGEPALEEDGRPFWDRNRV
jgi:hypothetical protein